jgi:hypothetical protein
MTHYLANLTLNIGLFKSIFFFFVIGINKLPLLNKNEEPRTKTTAGN